MRSKNLLGYLVLVFLVACGGGGGGGSSTPTSGVPVPTNAGGIWEGTATTSGITIDFSGVVTEDGSARFFDENGTQYIISRVSGNDGNITLEFTAVAQFGFQFLDGSTVTTGSMSGSVVERSSISGSYSVATGESGTISLAYNPMYERDSSLTRLEGLWDDSGYGTLTFDPDGSFFEQDTFGCVYNGRASLIDPNYNAYRLTMTVSLCGPDFDGQYDGLGVLTDYAAIDDAFIVQMNSNSLIFTTALLRL